MAEENLLMMDDVYSLFMVHAMILMDAPVEFEPPKSDATLHKMTPRKGYILQAYVLVEIHSGTFQASPAPALRSS